MHTRVVEITSKPEKALELCRTIEDQISPILKKQHGFIDELVMVSDSDPNRVIGQSLWKTKDDAHRHEAGKRGSYTRSREIRAYCTQAMGIRKRAQSIGSPLEHSVWQFC